LIIIFIIISYLLGSIPSAYLAGKMVKGIDIRKVGDGNSGAANVFREVGPTAGLVVMVADILKGSAAIWISQPFSSQPTVFLCGLAAVVGHIWPVFTGFKGGRGEATASGVLVVLLPQPMLILLAIAIVPMIITRNTMLLAAILFAPLWLVAWLMGASGALIGYSIGLPIVVGLNHVFNTRNIPVEIKKRSHLMR
jgi:acyl phosphate:glycerol-3-phosphate acyltransferase